MRTIKLTHDQFSILVNALDRHTNDLLNVAKQVADIGHNNTQIRDDYTKQTEFLSDLNEGRLDV